MYDGEVVYINGMSVQIIYTPGHTGGCAVYIVDGAYLFAGDLFVNPNRARYDAELQKKNQSHVLGLNGIEYVFNGHFGLVKDIRIYKWRY